MDVDPRSRATGNTLVGPEERGLSLESIALDQFIEMLKKGPINERVAPKTITLPDSLCAALRRAATAAYNDGVEHGGVFGYFAGEPVKFGILYAAGQETQIALPSASAWPALRFLGGFHTHLYVQALQRGLMQVGGWAGGGPSGADLTNFLANEANASIVFAQTRSYVWKIYFLLKPQEGHLPGGPVKVGKDYEQRVMAAVAKGADPIEATDAELKSLARSGAFVFYSAVDAGFEAGGRPRTGSVVLSRQS